MPDITHLTPEKLSLRRRYFLDDFPREPVDDLERRVLKVEGFSTLPSVCDVVSPRGWVCSRYAHADGDHVASDGERIIDRWGEEVPRA
jgi:hypothetical protein